MLQNDEKIELVSLWLERAIHSNFSAQIWTSNALQHFM